MGLFEGTSFPWPINPLLARNGLMAAMLAKTGMPTTSTIIEGKYGVYRSFFFQDVPKALDEDLVTLGHEFELAKTQTKRHPTSSLNIIPIELTQRLVAEHALTPDRVASVEVTLPTEREQREAVRETVPRYTADGDTHTLAAHDPAEWLAETGQAVLAEGQLTRLADLIARLEDVPDVSEVMACTVPESQLAR